MSAPAEFRRGHWIHRRIYALGLFAVGASLALSLWAGLTAFEEIARHARSERELRARLTAERLNRVLTTRLQRLEETSAGAASPRDLGTLGRTLRQLHVREPKFFESVFLLDADGRVLVEEPAGRVAMDGPALAHEALAAHRPVYTPLRRREGDARLYALVPVRGGAGAFDGVVGAAINPEEDGLGALLDTTNLPEGASVDLVDISGVVFASSDAGRRLVMGDHAQEMAGLIRDRRSSSGACHGCHEDGTGRVVEEFAFAPLSIAPWGVNVRQPRNEARAFEASLGTRVSAASALLLAVMALFAYGAATSVTRPLQALTATAERLSRGELDRPVPELPSDEVGRLGAALERMRVALKDSLARVAQANGVLEARVEERTRELARLNQELAAREAARAAALRKVIYAQEDERRRIARELHDETSQSLAALTIALDGLARSAGDAGLRARIADASSLSVRTLEEVHRLCMFLRPSALDDLGLTSAIRWYADKSLGARGVSVRCEFSGLDARLAPEVETAVFRCAQEALTNVARHAEAETVLVQCSRKDGVLTLDVEDDGRGFELTSVDVPDAKGRGLGLLGIRERVELLGGALVLESSPGQGTHLNITVPIPEAEARHG